MRASAAAAVLLLAALHATAPAAARVPASVSAFCSIAPQEFFVQRVGGDLVSVKVLVGPGQSPHTFEPTPRQMADLAESDVYFAIGMPFENRVLGRVEELGSGIRVVDTSDGVPRRRVEDAHGHDHVEALRKVVDLYFEGMVREVGRIQDSIPILADATVRTSAPPPREGMNTIPGPAGLPAAQVAVPAAPPVPGVAADRCRPPPRLRRRCHRSRCRLRRDQCRDRPPPRCSGHRRRNRARHRQP